MLTESFWIFAITTIVSILASALTLVFFQVTSARRRRERDIHAKMDQYREQLEKRMIDLNARLLSTEPRWREANHLMISGAHLSDLTTQRELRLSGFLRAAGLTEHDLQVDSKLVFVLTPFHPTFEPTYHSIRDSCADLGLTCIRGDETYVRGDIFPTILRGIMRARFIIANIDGRNPNVFYELGLAHGLDKHVIMVAKQIDDVPFDLRTKHIVLFQSSEDLEAKLRFALTRLALDTSGM